MNPKSPTFSGEPQSQGLTATTQTDATTPVPVSPQGPLREPSDTPYCVPFALAALAGVTVRQAAIWIHEEIGDQPISGIFYPLALKILRAKGFNFEETRLSEPDGNYLIVVHQHVLALLRGVYFDTKNPKGTTEFKASRVEKVFKIWKEKD